MQKRLEPLGWFCLALLAATGMFQMSAHPNYEGFLVIDNTWGAAILIKHLTFGVMILVSAYMTWSVLPALRRNALRQSQGQVVDTQLERRSVLLLNLNLALAVIILALTALARAS
jgi:putative copper export protein